MLHIYSVENPRRPVNWRWERARAIAEGGHPLSRRQAISVSDLVNQPLIVPERRSRPHSHDLTMRMFSDAGLPATVVQLADDAAFTKNVRTIFNNDQSDVDGLGAGTNREYFETNEGKLIEAKGAVARYVRTYSKGSTESRLNEYTEVEVYGRKPGE